MSIWNLFGWFGTSQSDSNKIDTSPRSLTPQFNTYGNPYPVNPHITLDDDKKTIIIGDIHGCLMELKELLEKCNYDESTRLIFVGDLVNKGPYSLEVLQYVRSLNAYCVRGNHDEHALHYALNPSEIPLKPKYEYVKSFTREDIEWLQELPYSITLSAYKAIVVHAGRVPYTTLEEQSYLDYVTMRNLIPLEQTMTENSPLQYQVHDGHKKGTAWAEIWSRLNPTPLHVYFGHDAKRGLQQHAYATGLDTGVCYGRQLTAIILPSKEIVQVNAHQVYEQPKTKK